VVYSARVSGARRWRGFSPDTKRASGSNSVGAKAPPPPRARNPSILGLVPRAHVSTGGNWAWGAHYYIDFQIQSLPSRSAVSLDGCLKKGAFCESVLQAAKASLGYPLSVFKKLFTSKSHCQQKPHSLHRIVAVLWWGASVFRVHWDYTCMYSLLRQGRARYYLPSALPSSVRMYT